MFPDSVNSDGSKFYLGDANGHRIDDDDLMVLRSDGSSQMVPWCLSQYLEIRGTRYLMGHVHSPNKIADKILFSIVLNQKLDSLQDKLLVTTESDETFLGLSNQRKPGLVLLPGMF